MATSGGKLLLGSILLIVTATRVSSTYIVVSNVDSSRNSTKSPIQTIQTETLKSWDKIKLYMPDETNVKQVSSPGSYPFIYPYWYIRSGEYFE
ncbi:hypothetical protein SNE40_016097 [Patella caerulea]|uniref:Uncharacterized protein n=1 Tax=Patella caerulea TaxID=87958 RepID=A0AAN8J9A4_PATCE